MSAAPLPTRHPKHAALLVVALLSVYFVWGSTYLAIKYAIETIPPFLMAGARFSIAGVIMYAFVRLHGTPAPLRRHWKGATVCGALMMLASNGLVTWSEQYVDSSLAALVVSTVPVWLLLLEWLRPRGTRPGFWNVLGVAIGVGGVMMLVIPESWLGGAPSTMHARPIGIVALLVATLSWSAGSIYARTADLPSASLMRTAMTMLTGGALQILAGSALGEWGRLELDEVSARSFWSMIYLTIAGSLVGFSAYVWLLRNTAPALAASYAFVNPLVAVGLGWAFGNEIPDARTLAAAAVIVVAVGIVVLTRKHAAPEPSEPERDAQVDAERGEVA